MSAMQRTDQIDREVELLLGRLNVVKTCIGIEDEHEQAAVNPAFKDDKFLGLKHSITTKMSEVRKMIEEKVNLAATNQKVELAKTNDAVRRKLNSIEDQVDELERIHKAELRKKKSKLSAPELEARTELVAAFREEFGVLKTANRTGQVTSSTNRIIAMESHELFKSKKSRTNGAAAQRVEQEEVTQEQQMRLQRIKRTEKEEDAKIEMIARGVDGLHGKAKAFEQELHVQKDIINSLENEVDHAQERLEGVNERLKGILTEVDRGEGQFCMDLVCIVILLGMAALLYQIAKGT